MRSLALSALLLCAAVAWAQQIPTRPLLEEMTRAEQGGIPASVHTRFAIGNGLVLDSNTVLVARHALLTPGGAIADEIGVGTSRPPLNNIMETRSVPIAQDPEHDLALLRLLGDSSPMGAIQAMPTSVGQRCSCSPHAVHAHLRSRRARRTRRPDRSSVVRLLQARAAAPVRLRIVWDGPRPAAR